MIPRFIELQCIHHQNTIKGAALPLTVRVNAIRSVQPSQGIPVQDPRIQSIVQLDDGKMLLCTNEYEELTCMLEVRIIALPVEPTEPLEIPAEEAHGEPVTMDFLRTDFRT